MNRRTFRCASLALAILMLSSAAAASQDWHLDATASRVLGVGEAKVWGNLAIMIHKETPLLSPPAPMFVLKADNLHVATDRSEAAIGPPAAVYLQPQTARADHTDATVTGLLVRDHYRFIVTALDAASPPVVHGDAACGQAGPSDAKEDRRSSHVQDREDMVTDLSATLTWHSCDGEGEIVIQGDFLVNLWDWDAYLETPDHEETLWSGRQAMDGADGTEEQFGRAQEHFLTARNATLTMPAPAHPDRLYVEDASMAAMHLSVNQATGSLSGPRVIDLDGQDLSFTDAENVRLGPGLHISYEGPAHDLSLDGKPIAVQGPLIQDSTTGPALWIWFGAVALLAAGMYPAWHYLSLRRRRPAEMEPYPRSTWLQRRASGLASQAKRRLDHGYLWSGLLLVRLALVFSRHPQIRATQVIAYHDMDRVVPALRIHELLDEAFEDSPSERCRNAWHAMCIARRNGLDEEVDIWMERAQHYDMEQFLERSRTMFHDAELATSWVAREEPDAAYS